MPYPHPGLVPGAGLAPSPGADYIHSLPPMSGNDTYLGEGTVTYVGAGQEPAAIVFDGHLI